MTDMTQIPENQVIQVSSPAEPFALTIADKLPAWAIFQKQINDKKNYHINELKQNFPACQQILSLFLHLHSDCTYPDLAAYKTLEWLADVIQDNDVVYTHIAFSDGPATGKSFLCTEILKPIFGKKADFLKIKEPEFEILPLELNFFEIQSNNPHQEMFNIYEMLSIAKGFDYPSEAIIFITNQFIKPEPSNRLFRIARCSTPLNDSLQQAVTLEIANGGLLQFADLLHTIHGSTKELPDLNAIY